MQELKINNISFITGRWPLDKSLPTIVFIHGSGGTNILWKDQVEMLSEEMNTIALDLPGHGKSSGESMNQIQSYARITSDFIHSIDIKMPVICGLSMGGAITLQLLIDNSENYRAGIIVNSGAKLKVSPIIFEMIENDYEGFIKALAVMGASEKTDPNMLKPFSESIATCPPSVAKGDFEACNVFDVMDQLSEIKVPVLVLTASDDKLTQVKYGTFLSDNIKDSQTIMIEDAGHLSPVEKPDEISDIFKNFLKSVE